MKEVSVNEHEIGRLFSYISFLVEEIRKDIEGIIK